MFSQILVKPHSYEASFTLFLSFQKATLYPILHCCFCLILAFRRKFAPVSLDVLWKEANLFLYVSFQVYSWWVMGLIYATFRVLVSGKFRDIINHMGVLQLNNFLFSWWSQLLQISPSFMFKNGSFCTEDLLLQTHFDR